MPWSINTDTGWQVLIDSSVVIHDNAVVWKCFPHYWSLILWIQVPHICVGKLTIIGSDNGLSPGRRQAIIWTNAGILLIGPLGTNFSEILIAIETFSFKKMHLKMSSAKWHPFCLSFNVLMSWIYQSLVNSIIKINYISQNQHPC